MSKFDDFRAALPDISFDTLFDVGANVGSSTTVFRTEFPCAQIFAFEPIRASFDELTRLVGNDKRVHCFRYAMGSEPGTANMSATSTHPTNRIVTDGSATHANLEPVEIRTGDQFCDEHNVCRINFLKIDAEGFDLHVCQGFSRMLREQRVDLVEVEAGMNPGNTMHVPFEDFMRFLAAHNYFLFKIYSQKRERDRPLLRRCNAVFVSQAQVERNAQSYRKARTKLKRATARIGN